MHFFEEKANTKKTGEAGELLAEQHLREHGLTLVKRNYLCPLGEIDLVMREDDCLVFVEVRQRKNNNFGSPIETITVSKQRKIVKAAHHFLNYTKAPSRQALRFDVVGVVCDGHHSSIEWVPNAFGYEW